MRFIDPKFLYALVLIAIPILIHFFHFKRYKTVYFSQVGFLKAIRQESRKKNNLKQLLILLSRILAIIFLVIAFSQPYFPANKQNEKSSSQIVGIYIDNSFSMKRMNTNGILLDHAKNTAIDIINSYGPGVSFFILNNELNENGQQLLSKEQAISAISQTQESAKALKLSMVDQFLKNRIKQVSENAFASFYFLSDFQKYTTDIEELKDNNQVFHYFIQFAPENENNLIVDTLLV